MVGISKDLNLIRMYGQTELSNNPAKELVRVLYQIVQQDIYQKAQLLSTAPDQRFFANLPIYIQRALEIVYVFYEVFIGMEYANWQPKSAKPRIIDIGGDPGAFSALFWKYLAPRADLTVIEANPSTAMVMKNNFKLRGMSEIEVINAAVVGDGRQHATLYLHPPGRGFHTGDFVNGKPETTIGHYSIEVQALKLSTIIDKKVDLLKMDIEGSELKVIRELEATGKLALIDQIIMEFHHDPQDLPDNSLLELLDILKFSGFIISNAHTTGAKFKNKRKIADSQIRKVSHSKGRVFLTFSAVRNSVVARIK